MTLNDYLTEQEQIQQLKTWLKQYAPTILLGILLSLALSYGWHYYQNYKTNLLTNASVLYDQMLGLYGSNQAGKGVANADQIIRDYPKTPYASLSALLLAREAVQNKKFDEAVTR